MLNPDDVATETWPKSPANGIRLGVPRGIKVTYRPTGVCVTCDTEASPDANREKALRFLIRLVGRQARN